MPAPLECARLATVSTQLCLEKMTPWCLRWLLKGQAASVCFSWGSVHAPALRGVQAVRVSAAGYSQNSVAVPRSLRHARDPVEVLQGESLPPFWPSVSNGDHHLGWPIQLSL